MTRTIRTLLAAAGLMGSLGLALAATPPQAAAATDKPVAETNVQTPATKAAKKQTKKHASAKRKAGKAKKTDKSAATAPAKGA